MEHYMIQRYYTNITSLPAVTLSRPIRRIARLCVKSYLKPKHTLFPACLAIRESTSSCIAQNSYLTVRDKFVFLV